MRDTPVIAVDAMGGDHGPPVVVSGSVAAARRFGVSIRLFGDQVKVASALAAHDTTGLDVTIVGTTDTIGMDEHPAQSVRRKPESSLVRAIRAVKDGDASAMVSAGNSGAVMAGALMSLGRIRGIERPALASYIPAKTGITLVLDLGAVTDPKPAQMVQFAIMGQTYARYIMDIPEPTVGLLSNGEEPGKGNQLTVAAHQLLMDTPGINFFGNVEGKDIALGTTNVVVTDGFTGNVALKVAEGTAGYIVDSLRDELARTPVRKLAALVLRPAFRAIARRMDYAEVGGAPLLGVDGTAIVSHGRSNERAIENAIGVAIQSNKKDLPARIAERVGYVPEAISPATV